MEDMTWREPPDIHEVQSTIKQRAALIAEIKALKVDLDYWEAYCTREKPRTPYVRVLGVDAESSEQIQTLRRTIMEKEQELALVDGSMEFLNFRKDLFKSYAFLDRR